MYRIYHLLAIFIFSIITCMFIFELYDKEKENKILKDNLNQLSRTIEIYNTDTTNLEKRNNLTNKKGMLEYDHEEKRKP